MYYYSPTSRIILNEKKVMEKQIIKILTKIKPEFDFTEDINFLEQGVLDSFDIIILTTTLEEQFGVKIDGVDVTPKNFDTINSIVNLLIRNGAKE